MPRLHPWMKLHTQKLRLSEEAARDEVQEAAVAVYSITMSQVGVAAYSTAPPALALYPAGTRVKICAE